MKASELRIGNYVNRLNFGQYEITQIKQGSVQTNKGALPIRAIEGIPLTEEWLLKFGFEKPGIHYLKLVIGDSRDDLQSSLQVAFPECGYVQVCRAGINAYSAKVDYVHQLQNLYFALTGKELTLQP